MLLLLKMTSYLISLFIFDVTKRKVLTIWCATCIFNNGTNFFFATFFHSCFFSFSLIPKYNRNIFVAIEYRKGKEEKKRKDAYLLNLKMLSFVKNHFSINSSTFTKNSSCPVTVYEHKMLLKMRLSFLTSQYYTIDICNVIQWNPIFQYRTMNSKTLCVCLKYFQCFFMNNCFHFYYCDIVITLCHMHEFVT